MTQFRDLIAAATAPPLTLSRISERAKELNQIAAHIELADDEYRGMPGRSPFVNEREFHPVGALVHTVMQHSEDLFSNMAIPLLLHGRSSPAAVAATRLLLACATCATSERHEAHLLELLRDEQLLRGLLAAAQARRVSRRGGASRPFRPRARPSVAHSPPRHRDLILTS